MTYRFGTALEELIDRYGLKRQDAAAVAGLSPVVLSKILRQGFRQMTHLGAIIRHLPRSEADRAYLQKELALEFLGDIAPLSPELRISLADVETGTDPLCKLIESGHFTPEVKRALAVVLLKAQRDPEALLLEYREANRYIPDLARQADALFGGEE